MHFVAGIRQKVRQRWQRVVGAAGTIAMLSAVVVAGGAQISSEVFSAWKTPGDAEQALASSSNIAGLLNFEAPAETVARFKTEAEQFENHMRRASNALLLVKNWKYTQDLLGLPPEYQDLQFFGGTIDLPTLLASHPILDFIILQASQTNPAIASYLDANPPLKAIAISGTLSVAGTFLGQVVLPTVTNIDNQARIVLQGIATTNPAVAPLVTFIVNTLNAVKTQITTTLAYTVLAANALQIAINTQLQNNGFATPPPIPPASPSS